MKIGIFTSFQDEKLVQQAVHSCRELCLDYEIVDILSANWIENVMKSDCDGFYCPSTCISQEKKTIQDERYFFVSQLMHRPIYPSYLGLYIHENKRNMAAWLELNAYPHARTMVFTKREEALDYLNTCSYPVVIKANVGAGASKIRIVKSKAKAIRMAKKSLAPNSLLNFLRFGLIYQMKFNHNYILPMPDLRNTQKDYFLVQDYVKDVLHEWRIIKIGDSYFGHQKLLKDGFASGSGLVGWVMPPRHLLDMVRELCDKGGFPCMDVDIFETKNGVFIINELQTFFGSYLDYQMCVDGKHGRLVYRNDDYVFEEGDFNVYGSTKLKIEHFASLLGER